LASQTRGYSAQARLTFKQGVESSILSAPITTIELVGVLNREGLRAQRQRALLWLKDDLIDSTGAPVVRLSFPVPNRSAGHQIAAALGLLGSS